MLEMREVVMDLESIKVSHPGYSDQKLKTIT